LTQSHHVWLFESARNQWRRSFVVISITARQRQHMANGTVLFTPSACFAQCYIVQWEIIPQPCLSLEW
jgi:hypothetical protein